MAIITFSDKCTGCGACIKTCPQLILELSDEKKMKIIDHDRCMSCFGCEDSCNFEAVFIKKAPYPEMKENEINVEDNGKPESEYDVIIVGAGPSGLGTAISCAEQGLKTAIFDRLPNREVSHHNDGGVLFSYPAATSIKVSDDGYLELPEFDFRLKDSFIVSKMDWLSIEGPKGYRFDDKFKKGLEGHICSKDRLVHELVNKAEKSGANVFYNSRVKNVIKEKGKISGIILQDGTKVHSKVVVTADGILAKLSAKTKIPVNKSPIGYIQYQTLFYERPEGLTSGFSYVMGALNLGDDVPPPIACIGVGEHIEVSLILTSKKKFYQPQKPMDYYIKKILASDERVRKYLGGHADNLKYITIKGTRLRLRELSKTISVDGAVAVGDNWVSGAQLGNINSIANGIYTGREIKKAFDRNDFSKESLGLASKFVNKDVEMFINQIAKMSTYPLVMDEETIAEYFRIFHTINYPTLFFGSKKRIMMMMMGIVFKNIFKLMANRKMFKYM